MPSHPCRFVSKSDFKSVVGSVSQGVSKLKYTILLMVFLITRLLAASTKLGGWHPASHAKPPAPGVIELMETQVVAAEDQMGGMCMNMPNI